MALAAGLLPGWLDPDRLPAGPGEGLGHTPARQHEFLDENAPITISFNDFSSGAFTIHSVSMGRDSALISVGLTAQLDNPMAIFVEANADVNENYNAENFVGGFKGSF